MRPATSHHSWILALAITLLSWLMLPQESPATQQTASACPAGYAILDQPIGLGVSNGFGVDWVSIAPRAAHHYCAVLTQPVAQLRVSEVWRGSQCGRISVSLVPPPHSGLRVQSAPPAKTNTLSLPGAIGQTNGAVPSGSYLIELVNEDDGSDCPGSQYQLYWEWGAVGDPPPPEEPAFLKDRLAPDSYKAEFISQQVPTTLQPGETVDVSLTFKNIGTTTWLGGRYDGIKLLFPKAIVHQANWEYIQNHTTGYPLSNTAPGHTVTIPLKITAPVAGTYTFSAMLGYRGGKMGDKAQSPAIAVTVGDPAAVLTRCPTGYTRIDRSSVILFSSAPDVYDGKKMTLDVGGLDHVCFVVDEPLTLGMLQVHIVNWNEGIGNALQLTMTPPPRSGLQIQTSNGGQAGITFIYNNGMMRHGLSIVPGMYLLDVSAATDTSSAIPYLASWTGDYTHFLETKGDPGTEHHYTGLLQVGDRIEVMRAVNCGSAGTLNQGTRATLLGRPNFFSGGWAWSVPVSGKICNVPDDALSVVGYDL